MREVLKQMDKDGLEVLIVTDKTGRLLGTVTDINVIKALIKNIGFNNNHKYFMQEAALSLSSQRKCRQGKTQESCFIISQDIYNVSE